jgi:peptide/nickel transport system permease protein
MHQIRFIGARFAIAAGTLLCVSVVVFGALHMIPGDFAHAVLGVRATPAQIANLNRRLDLDRPLPVQYIAWLASICRGDFGRSLTTGAPVSATIAQRAPVTAELAVLATLFSALIGVPLGIFSALARRRRFVGGTSRIVGALSLSVPDFVIGSVLLYLFSRYNLYFHVGGYVSLSQSVGGNLRTILIPSVTLGVLCSALVMRTTRAAVLDVMVQKHIVAAVARGESPSQIVRRHVLRNIAIPSVTVIGTNLGYLLGGAVVVETLFSLPGLGSLMVDAIGIRDYPVVEADVLIGAAAFVVINLLIDLSYGLIDPRVVQ